MLFTNFFSFYNISISISLLLITIYLCSDKFPQECLNKKIEKLDIKTILTNNINYLKKAYILLHDNYNYQEVNNYLTQIDTEEENLIDIIENLGNRYNKLDLNVQALNLYQESLRIKKKIDPNNNSYLGNTMDTILQLNAAVSDRSEAKYVFLQTLEIKKQKLI